jgi:hypothetical protein
MLKKAFKQGLTLALSSILLNNCTWHRAETVPQVKQQMVAPIVIAENMQEFTKVNIDGKIDVNIHVGNNFHKIVFHGVQPDITSTERNVKYGELFIKLGKNLPKYGYIKVDIYMRKMTAFTYNGSGNIFAGGISSNCIDINIDNDKNANFAGSFGLGYAKFSNFGYYKIQGVHGCATNLTIQDNAKVEITGHSNLANLTMGDDSQLSLYRVSSKSIKIKLKDNARVQLSGVTETLNDEQWDKSRLDSRNLISQISFVKTHDYSQAYIAALRNQHTLAKDKSNIYYYYLPENHTNFMAKDGSVLDMREWHLSTR